MGIFFNRKKKSKKDAEPQVEKLVVALSDPKSGDDMVNIIKNEQTSDISNPFAKDTEFKSVAKRFGTKYSLVAKSGQVASSKVVDVRSYVKKPIESKKEEKLDFEKELDSIDKEKPKMSFFDELMKSIDDDMAELESEVGDDVVELPPIVEKKEKKQLAKTSKPKKRAIDIDIISGDFGGTDII